MLALGFVALTSFISVVLSQLSLCQDNCVSPDRLVGPTKMPNTRPHPFKIAQFPSVQSQFCQLGCQMFFSQYPTQVGCREACDFQYRYRLTNGYSDVATEALLECRDGCDIALQVCQTGFYCTEGAMLPCPPGTYRTGLPGVSIIDLKNAFVCTNCPPGRYRSRAKGTDIVSCSKCPIGKYTSVTGSVLVSDCLRCAAGKFAEEEGMAECKCISDDSCGLEYSSLSVLDANYTNFYANGIDFGRETVPYRGRS